jgi:hypothetical protein
MLAVTWTALGILAAAVFGMFAYTAAGFGRIDARLDALAGRMDAQFARVDARFDSMDAKFDRLAARFDEHVHPHAG